MKNDSHSHHTLISHNLLTIEKSCPRCNGQNLKSGAGKRPGEQSIHCRDCRKFICYQPVRKPKKRRKPGLEPISAILARLEFGGEA